MMKNIQPQRTQGYAGETHFPSRRIRKNTEGISRRAFIAASTVLPWAFRVIASAASASKIPVGLELYSVRDAFKADGEGTVRAVALLGYQAVEFYAPYHDWTDEQAKSMRKVMDEVGIKCYSTHNNEDYFGAEKIDRTRDLNLILGCRYVVQAWSDPKVKLDDYKKLADSLNAAADRLAPSGLKVGYHNHDAEWKEVEGKRPMDILAEGTKPAVMLQLDVGTCLAAGADPVAWIKANPGRIHSMHCKDWSRDPAVGYKTLFGEGIADWKAIFNAAENGGGIEYYLVEQEGSRYSELDTAKRCLQGFRAAHVA
jgi:sugar phosphate isomerase/epimerase